ncbi:hypothetical protein E3N88_01575 [Mikania micrantha]|uniref:Histone-lysine N-methyltransferase n=1 Tax=Mikania micrantha TaxID=192012 RepID=A0A5N6Q1G3_9ASTR|nr:hypothetical protein E3N88_01575 [Mikania micrantha]
MESEEPFLEGDYNDDDVETVNKFDENTIKGRRSMLSSIYSRIVNDKKTFAKAIIETRSIFPDDMIVAEFVNKYDEVYNEELEFDDYILSKRETNIKSASVEHGETPVSSKETSNETNKELPETLILETESDDYEQVFERLGDGIGEKPVDFELPAGLNKCKSQSNFSIIRRNIYRTKKVKRRVRVEDDGIFCSCSSTPGSSGVCGRDCHCGMLLSCCSSNCKCDNSCLNKPFHQRPMKKMKIVQTEKCGSGVVAEEDIMRGEFIIEYVGEVIDDKECEKRLWTMKDRGETNFYLCEINRDMVIDATYKGNKSRYINHSCSPNTEMQKWMIDGETRIGIFASMDIKNGEHLTYDYQFVQFGADQDCHCGAVGCRRKLGVKPNKSKFPSSDAALKMVACQVAINSPKVKAVLSGKDVRCSRHAIDQTGIPRNCIGQVLKLRPESEILFGIIKRFDINTRKHLIQHENACAETLVQQGVVHLTRVISDNGGSIERTNWHTWNRVYGRIEDVVIGIEEMAWRKMPMLNRNLMSLLPFNSNAFVANYSSKSNLYPVKVGIPEFLNGIGNGVETYAEKLESEFGDLQNLLVARSMKLKKLNVGGDPKVCKHVLVKLNLVYQKQYSA